MKKTFQIFIPLLLLAVFSIGCGGKSKGPSTIKVTGTLKINGSPAKENIQITFHPVAKDQQTASGNTDSSGKYSLFTGNTGTPGVMVGKYKIVARDIDAGNDESYMDQTEETVTTEGSESSTPSVTGVIPEKFSDVKTTDYEVEVTSSSTTIDIDLK